VAKSVGISTKAVIDLLAKEAGGMENIEFTRVDVKNGLYTKIILKYTKGTLEASWNIWRRRHQKMLSSSTLFKLMRII
jgi:zinc finger SWIM domain-containing protein 3